MPAQILTAVLIAHEAADLRGFYNQGGGPDEQCFTVLGRFDHLTLRVSDSNSTPILGTMANARAASGCSYLGHILSPDDFHPGEWAATHPLMGYCALRLARRALRAAGSFDFLRTYLEKEFNQDADLRWALVSTTGWEDVLVLVFGRSFNAIKCAIGKIRGLHADNAGLPTPPSREDGFHHLVLTSCTLPAIASGWHPEWNKADTTALLKRLKADERLRWAVRIEVYPGHWDAFAQLLKERCVAAGLPVDIAPLFGQADLRVVPERNEDYSHRGLVSFLTEVMFPLEIEERSVIRTVETRLIPEFTGYHEDSGAAARSTRLLPKGETDMVAQYRSHSKSALDTLGAPPHTQLALEETMSRIQGMAGDRLHGEEFGTIRALADAFIHATRHVSPPTDIRDFEIEARETLRDISDWQLQIERCLADRFRGPYPAGDSMMLRLGSHPGAHHRFLVVMDHFAQRAYNLARTCINQRLGTQTLPDVALATFIGNSPSAYAIGHMVRRLRCGFTDVPAHMVCRLKDAHVVAHETGHHLFRAFACSNGFQIDQDVEKALQAHLVELGIEASRIETIVSRHMKGDSLQRDIKEILADFFACHICYRGNHKIYAEAAYQTIGRYYEGCGEDHLFMRSVLTDIGLRQRGIAALIQSEEDVLACFDKEASVFANALIPSGGSIATPKYGRLKERTDAIRLALQIILRLQRHRGFEALMSGIKDCGLTADFPGEPENVGFLFTFREFMSNSSPRSDAAHLSFLDQLWFIVLRSQSSLLS